MCEVKLLEYLLGFNEKDLLEELFNLHILKRESCGYKVIQKNKDGFDIICSSFSKDDIWRVLNHLGNYGVLFNTTEQDCEARIQIFGIEED